MKNVYHWLIGCVSKRRMALLLYRRGMIRAKKHDHRGAIDDYTATIESSDTPAEIKAMTLYNRALVYSALDERSKAIEDLQSVLSMAGASSQVKKEANRRLARVQLRSDRPGTRATSHA